MSFDPFTAHDRDEYHTLRKDSSAFVYNKAGIHFVSISRYDDIRTVLTQRRIYSMKHGQMHYFLPGMGLNVDPPAHSELRRALNPFFALENIEKYRGAITGLIDSLIDNVEPRKEIDFYTEYGQHYSVGVASILFGIDPDMKEQFAAWVRAFIEGSTSGNEALMEEGRGAVAGYFEKAIEERRKRIEGGETGANDLIQLFATIERSNGEPFPKDELLATAILLLAGSIDTQAMMLSNCVYRLLEQRSRWEKLCRDAALIPAAIEESLRFDSPVFGTFRTNNEPVCLHGCNLEPDTKIQMLFGSANRDPSIFEKPDEFRLDRDAKDLRRRHLAFGGGDHACIGMWVARFAAEIALSRLTARFPGMTLNGEVRLHETAPGAIAVNNGVAALPVSW